MQQQSLQALRKQQRLNDINLIDSVVLHERTTALDDHSGERNSAGRVTPTGNVLVNLDQDSHSDQRRGIPIETSVPTGIVYFSKKGDVKLT